MFNFINFLRVLAAVLITNSHYSEIWPVSSLATGGLLGNVIFFAVSGFCLYSVKDPFVKWYAKRFARIYPIVAVFTAITVLMGMYHIDGFSSFIKLFVFPTNYIFIVWMLILYVPFYFVCKLDRKNENTVKYVLLGTALLWILAYIAFVDKSVYCVDDVNSPFIMFVYFASMLTGAYLRKHREMVKKTSCKRVLCLAFGFCLYFGSKIVFSKVAKLVILQPLNQIFLMVAMLLVFVTAMGLEDRTEKVNPKLLGLVKSVSSITLHIYVVQFVVIGSFAHLAFPIDLFVVTSLILVGAFALYYAEYLSKKGIVLLLHKFNYKKRLENKCRK